MSNRFDTIIIGAGLSGLAAGIRLAHFEQNVVIVESHSLCGGLNSWYRRKGQVIDVGLHAMTNYIPKGGKKGPLTKLLRQLRIPYDALNLCPQTQSRIVFPNTELTFTNDLEVLRKSVEASYPGETAGLDTLIEVIDSFDEVSLAPPKMSARNELAKYLHEPSLIDMLLTPLMFYGNPDEHDMDFAQFAVMWKSIYCSGFARPAGGMKPVIEMLVNRFRESGGTLLTNTAVTQLNAEGTQIKSVVLENGDVLTGNIVLSCAGYNETLQLIPQVGQGIPQARLGKLSFVEQVLFLDRPVAQFGLEDSIVFFNNEPSLVYERPESPVVYSNGVLCCPGNFDGIEDSGRNELRVTLRASFPEWDTLYDQGQEIYEEMKNNVAVDIVALLEKKFSLRLSGHIIFSDLFTPLTIERFSGHVGGAVYGSPDKFRSGECGYDNLRIIGTDQGFLGIVGAMLSGITVANLTLNT